MSRFPMRPSSLRVLRSYIREHDDIEHCPNDQILYGFPDEIVLGASKYKPIFFGLIFVISYQATVKAHNCMRHTDF
jgi:hypothetical protein